MERQLKSALRKNEVPAREENKKVHFALMERGGQQNSAAADQRKRHSQGLRQSVLKKPKAVIQVENIHKADDLISEAEIQLKELDTKVNSEIAKGIELYHSIAEDVCAMVDMDGMLTRSSGELERAKQIVENEQCTEEFSKLENLCEETIAIDKLHADFIDSLDESVSYLDAGNIDCLSDQLPQMERLLEKLTT